MTRPDETTDRAGSLSAPTEGASMGASPSIAVVAARFLVVGLGAAIVDVGLLALLHDVLGVRVEVATPVAFLTAFFLTYVLQRTLTFRTRAAFGASFVRYVLLVVVNVLATTAIVATAVSVGAPWIAGKVTALAVTTVWNFFLYRHWVFPASSAASAGSVRDAG